MIKRSFNLLTALHLQQCLLVLMRAVDKRKLRARSSAESEHNHCGLPRRLRRHTSLRSHCCDFSLCRGVEIIVQIVLTVHEVASASYLWSYDFQIGLNKSRLALLHRE